jgi:predicted helicase
MARIFYFTLQDEQTKDEKLDWFANIKIEQIPFDRITPDKKANWVNQTDNDFDDLLPLVDKGVKAGKSEKAIF